MSEVRRKRGRPVGSTNKTKDRKDSGGPPHQGQDEAKTETGVSGPLQRRERKEDSLVIGNKTFLENETFIAPGKGQVKYTIKKVNEHSITLFNPLKNREHTLLINEFKFYCKAWFPHFFEEVK